MGFTPADPGELIAAPNTVPAPNRPKRLSLSSFWLRITIPDKRELRTIQLAWVAGGIYGSVNVRLHAKTVCE